MSDPSKPGEPTTLHYEVLEPGDEGVAVITLDRPEARNAQNKRMTYELNAAFDDAARRTDVKVIVLRAGGPHFCSGHDMRDRESHRQFDLVSTHGGFSREGQEGQMAFEEEVYFQMCWRWRNIPKPVIAAAQGKTIAGGLMLLWIADVILAADDASFSDPVVGMGVNGVEYFAHPWEFGARKAKELLFTGDYVSAQDALQLGMVNRVVPADQLREETLRLARRIATRPSFALKLAKESVNQTLEAQGQWTALRSAFSLQHLAHAHNRIRFGVPVDPGSGRRPATSG
ncbi:enoyl-CoA hydratase [Desertimonas flava]|uniref:enoyl-CoA hydratase n=1 Tax=Desertimonas flava TaxID=2064846 RepID=UPI00196947A6|nr:enoyl-CoA hydratase [Desertimonas flava]